VIRPAGIRNSAAASSVGSPSAIDRTMRRRQVTDPRFIDSANDRPWATVSTAASSSPRSRCARAVRSRARLCRELGLGLGERRDGVINGGLGVGALGESVGEYAAGGL
jgi:hypothetical protein